MSNENKNFIRIICILNPETAEDIQFNFDNWKELTKEDQKETIKAGHELFGTKTLKELKITVKKELVKQAKKTEQKLIFERINGVFIITTEKIQKVINKENTGNAVAS